MLYFIRLDGSEKYFRNEYNETLYFISEERAKDYLVYRSGLDNIEIEDAKIEKLDIDLCYCYDERYFANIDDLINFTNGINLIVKDETIKHDFKLEDIVYVAIRDKIRKCKVINISESYDEEYDEETTLRYRTLFSEIDLFDLSTESKNESDNYRTYSYRKSKIYHIKRTIEELIAE